MSYDLYFKPRTGAFDASRFTQYFKDRQRYKVEAGQAVYQNEDTGVYFLFELQSPEETSPKDRDEEFSFPLALNLNFFRPSYFGLEAESEVALVVRELDLLVSDPQMQGMGEGSYNSELFLAGWNHGNQMAYAAILADPANRNVSSLPAAALTGIWKWNYGRQALQTDVGNMKFVPRIRFGRVDGNLATIAVWADGIPVVVPPVDYLFVPRKELAPKKFFKRTEDVTLVSWKVALPVLLRHSTKKYGEAIALDYERPPKEVAAFIASLPADTRGLSVLAEDSVLDRELVEKYSSEATPDS
jgi:hypothetical protein